MRPLLGLLGALSCAVGLIGAALVFVSQAAASTAPAVAVMPQQTHSAWGLVVSEGLGNPYNQTLNTFQEFNGQLYAGTSNPLGAEIWRSSDGLSWTPAVTGSPALSYSAHVLDLAVFKDHLYAASFRLAQGGLIWRSPDGISWTLVVPLNGLGQGELQAFAQMTAFSGSLYVANAANYDHQQSLWQTADGLTWQPITTTGLMSASPTALLVFGDRLYAGTRDATAGAALWQTDGLTWKAVITNGFGIAQNSAIAGLGIFNDQLYAVTENQSMNLQIWRSANGIDWTQVVSGGLGRPPHNPGSGAKLIAFNGEFFLFTGQLMQNNEVYRSANGSDWDQITFDAWGAARHSSLQDSMTIFRGRLLVGAGNFTTTAGCQIWSYLNQAVYLPITELRR